MNEFLNRWMNKWMNKINNHLWNDNQFVVMYVKHDLIW